MPGDILEVGLERRISFVKLGVITF